MLSKLILLIGGHLICDFPLQSDFLAIGKNPNTPKTGMPWWYILFAHCGIHMMMVYVITHSAWMALAELVIHYATDWAKCAGLFNSETVLLMTESPGRVAPLSQLVKKRPNQAFLLDQAIHLVCKVIWAVL